MLITKQNHYALRAIYELAKQQGCGPVKISFIAEAQSIPVRFLEVILGKLKKSGFVRSKRGYHGGYELILSPEKLTVGDLLRFLQKDVQIAECMAPSPESRCPFKGDCAFYPMWKEIKESMFRVFDTTTIKDLLDNERVDGQYPM